MKLSECILAEGCGVQLHASPASHPDTVGEPAGPVAITASGEVLLDEDTWDYAYAASHEIAEHRHGFEHTEAMWVEQANILARWHRLRGGE